MNNNNSYNSVDHSIDTSMLLFRTRGQKNPQGLPRVFFSCYPSEFHTFFDVVYELLDEHQDIALFYESLDQVLPWETLSTLLLDIQLIVIPVTSTLLHEDNRTVRLVLPFANENHIPVLPLLMEEGLDASFQVVFGDTQYLQPGKKEIAALPFDQKLDSYLKNILVDSEIAQKVRNAFDAYVFLSYRKKDRAFARKLMKMIHQNEHYRDIAIWYDEYLVPGEDFNDAIKKALETSDFFTLVVTPNLLERYNGQPNYVMAHEFPEAKRSSKPILPVEMVKTNFDQLSQDYAGIDNCIDGNDPDTLQDALLQHWKNIATQKRANDPQHNFLIGLAYLDGIDVEVNHERAVSLITEAAQSGLEEAIRKLTVMYREGKGVARDYEMSAEWQERLIEEIKANRIQNANPQMLMWELHELGNLRMHMWDYEKAKKTFGELMTTYVVEFARSREKRYFDLITFCFLQFGEIERFQGHYDKAREIYESNLQNYLSMMKESGFDCDYEIVAEFYTQLGEIYNLLGNTNKAQECLQQADSYLSKQNKDRDTRRERSVMLIKLGDSALDNGDYGQAKSCYSESLQICRQLYDENRSVQARQDICVALGGLSDICVVLNDYKQARTYQEESLKLHKQLVEETDSIYDKHHLVLCLVKLGRINNYEGFTDKAQKNYLEAYECVQSYVDIAESEESYLDFASVNLELGDLYKSRSMLSDAHTHYMASFEYTNKAIKMAPTRENVRELSIILDRLGDIEKASGNIDNAESDYKKSLSIRNRLHDESATIESLDDLGISYYKLGLLGTSKAHIESIGRAFSIWRDLAEKYPDNPRFQSRRDSAYRLIIAWNKAYGEHNSDNSRTDKASTIAKESHRRPDSTNSTDSTDMADKLFAEGIALLSKNETSKGLQRILQAANSGFGDAQEWLGYNLFRLKKYEEAFHYTQLAATNGNVESQFRLGSMYATGTGTEVNFEKAIEWLQRAAANGHVTATNNLAIMYYQGKGMPSNPQRAITLLEGSASQGDALSQLNLGRIQESEGNYEEAEKWYTIAASQGDDEARKALEELKRRH